MGLQPNIGSHKATFILFFTNSTSLGSQKAAFIFSFLIQLISLSAPCMIASEMFSQSFQYHHERSIKESIFNQLLTYYLGEYLINMDLFNLENVHFLME